MMFNMRSLGHEKCSPEEAYSVLSYYYRANALHCEDNIMRKLEVIASTVEDATEGALGGASSLELVQNLAVGGLTPPLSVVKAIRNKVTVHLRVIIRPHAPDFVYSGAEIDQMLLDIDALKK